MPTPIRAVDQAANTLRDSILSGEHPSGTLLPPERALAGQIGVNRLTLRAALSRLEAEGLVRARQGQGVRVLDWRECSGLDLLRHLPPPPDNPDPWADILLVRATLLAEAAALACTHASREDLMDLVELVVQHAEADDPGAVVAADTALMRALVEIADNDALRLALNSICRVFADQDGLAQHLFTTRSRVGAGFRDLVTALVARDPDVIRTQVRMAMSPDGV